MPVIETKGAGSAQGFGEFTQSGPKVYIEDVFSTYLYTGNGVVNQINNGLPLGSNTATSGGGAIFKPSNLTCSSTVPSTFGTGDFTVEGLFYATAFNATFGEAILQCWTGPADADNAWGLRLDTTGKIVTATYNTTLSTGASSVSLNAWHHVAWSRVGSSNAVWLDGTRINTFTNAFDYSRAVNLRFGNDNGNGSNFIGAMSNVRLVKGSAVYNPSSSTITVPTAALTAVTNTSLLCLQGSSPFTDNSGNGYGFSNLSGGGYAVSTATDFGPFAAASVTAKGGMVWIKDRTTAYNHNLFDTVQGATKLLHSNTTGAQVTDTVSLTSFNSNGFTVGTGTTSGSEVNVSGDSIVSWAFTKQPKFFDVVTWSGNSVDGRSITHNLGSAPGCIIVKCTSSSTNWVTWHQGAAGTLWLNSSNADSANGGGQAVNYNTSGGIVYNPGTSTTAFTVSAGTAVNSSGNTYVAYIFASNAGGFGLAGTDNVISCGSITGTNSLASFNLGYEPQWLLIKSSTSATNWTIYNNMSGWTVDGNAQIVNPDLSSAESSVTGNSGPTATGFKYFGASGQTYIYIAIRRGPMRTPTTGTSVFLPSVTNTSGTTFTTGFNVDMFISTIRAGWARQALVVDRLRGQTASLETSNTSAESTAISSSNFAINNAYTNGGVSAPLVSLALGRAPGFFDEVCYTGTGANATQPHNLGAVPEMMIVKKRSAVTNWAVYHSALTAAGYALLNTTAASTTSSTFWQSTTPTAANFYIGTNGNVGDVGATYVAYLFATLAGVSKVGSYTGTGASQVINCGFTSGARFVLIKRTDTTGDWYVYNTAQGMVSGQDYYFFLNGTAAETNADYVFTSSTGFTIQAAAPAGINASGGTYIFLAIA